jgi:hypothetical protein
MANILLTIKRTYFWVLCPLVIILAGVFWVMGVSGLKKEKEKSLQEINTLFSSVDSVKSKPEYANSSVQDGMQKLIAKRRSEVAEAWARKYEQQTAEKIGILKWPDVSEFPEGDRADAAKLLAVVKDLRPIEKMLGDKASPEKNLVLSQRQIYEEYIRQKLPELADAIGAQWAVGLDPNAAAMGMTEGGRGAGPPGGGGEFNRGGYSSDGSDMFLPEEAIVLWNPTNQQEIVQSHFTWGIEQPFSGGMGPGRRMEGPGSSGPPGGYGTSQAAGGPRPPNLLEILYAQEDFWVLKALMEVISRTNKGATGQFNAAIKEIEFIRFGKDVQSAVGRIDTPMAEPDPNAPMEPGMGGPEGGRMEAGPPGAGPPGGGMPGGAPPDSYAAEGRRSEFGMGEPGADGGLAIPSSDPARGRYVDSSYAPLDPAVLRKVMTTPAEAAPEEHYLAVAKRIPVRMRVKIDQKKLYTFLLECANSELTLEVRQLRVNPSSDMDMAGMMSGGYGGMPGGYGMPGAPSSMGAGPPGEGRREGSSFGYGAGPGSGGYSTAMDGSMSAVDQHSRTDVTVEIYGIIYIYNPVDKVILKEPEAGDQAPAEDAVATT